MATVSGGTPTTTNGFCSPAFDRTGVEQRVAIAPTATRLRMIGGVDITLSPRESGSAVRLRVIAMEGLEGGGPLLPGHTTPTCSAFHVKSARGFDGESNQKSVISNQ